MKPVLIVENSTDSLIKESVDGKKDYVMSGTFTEFGVKNRNERVYTSERFLPALEEMNERIKSLGVVYGEFDHPDVFDTSLSRSSHIIRKADFVEESNSVRGEIKLLNTHWGKEAKALVDDECPIFVSSRAAGITESDGSVSLKKLFTYDIVADPGFASAKMSIQNINESLGFKDDNKTNFRIYEMSDESKINELFNMNKDYVTKDQMTDYSHYLVNELASVKKKVTTAITKGNVEPKKLEQLLEYYENLNESSTKVGEYLNYLSEKLQVVVKENVELKKTQSKLEKTQDDLIKHNDYLAENLEKNIAYSEYIAENVDKNISYSEYIAENVDKNIAYAEYIAENVDKNIAYSEYIAENVDKNIAYSEYIAENVDKNIAYSEYIAENLDTNIAYSEYIAENLDENISYSEYIAESLDKSVTLQGIITEKLRSSKINESNEDGVQIPTMEEAGFETIEDEFIEEEEGEKEEGGYNLDPLTEEEIAEIKAEIAEEEALEEAQRVEEAKKLEESKEDEEEGDDKECAEDKEETITEEKSEDCECEECECDPCECEKVEESTEETTEETVIENTEETEESDESLTESIEKLIKEATKRKVSETSDLNFLKFLNKSQIDSYYSLSDEDQDSVKLHINESDYFSSKDVLRLMTEALSHKSETVETRVLRMMPNDTKTKWEQLDESSKKGFLSQAKLYPEDLMMTESQIENFWSTRKFKTETTKKLVSHQGLIQEDKLTDGEVESIMEKFRSM